MSEDGQEIQKRESKFWSNAVFTCPIDFEFVSNDYMKTLDHLETHGIKILNIKSAIPFLDKYLNKVLKQVKEDKEYVFGLPNDWNDRQLRNKLQQETLVEILAIQEIERNTEQLYHCLFCRTNTNSRNELFNHLFSLHGLLIGMPDNLVYISEYLALLSNTLSSCICLYCEKVFTSTAILRKHMRKKKHFQINPKNTAYDKFYLSNYKEKEDDFDLEEEEGDFEDWKEKVSEPETQCLFCDLVFKNAMSCHLHLTTTHQFDLSSIDFYDRIRLINFIRFKYSKTTCFCCEKEFDNSNDLNKHFQLHQLDIPDKEHEMWKDPSFLFPFYEYDPLLMLDFEDGDSD